MKRVLQVLAIAWALGLVGWAVARAQGWLDEGAAVAVDEAPRLLPATKSDAGEGARAKPEEGPVAPASAEPPAPPPVDLELLGGTKSGTVVPRKPPKPADEVLLPATKSDMMRGIGGLIGEKGTQIGSEGLRAPPPQQPQEQQQPEAPQK